MSNQLGSIYATTKSAKKYIMLDSENVEVSGNFFINGTNSRMPAEIENSLRDYLPLTYGISDPNPTTIYDQFADLSENVLKQRKDASFNDLDVSGDFIVRGNFTTANVGNHTISKMTLAGNEIKKHEDPYTYGSFYKKGKWHNWYHNGSNQSYPALGDFGYGVDTAFNYYTTNIQLYNGYDYGHHRKFPPNNTIGTQSNSTHGSLDTGDEAFCLNTYYHLNTFAGFDISYANKAWCPWTGFDICNNINNDNDAFLKADTYGIEVQKSGYYNVLFNTQWDYNTVDWQGDLGFDKMGLVAVLLKNPGRSNQSYLLTSEINQSISSFREKSDSWLYPSSYYSGDINYHNIYLEEGESVGVGYLGFLHDKHRTDYPGNFGYNGNPYFQYSSDRKSLNTIGWYGGDRRQKLYVHNIILNKLEVQTVTTYNTIGLTSLQESFNQNFNARINNDVSFNSNVDISGDLNVNGNLTINNSFGISGEVLTSQGSNHTPIWKPSSFMHILEIHPLVKYNGGHFNPYQFGTSSKIDTANGWNSSTHKYTIPTSGYWYVQSIIGGFTNGAANFYHYIYHYNSSTQSTATIADGRALFNDLGSTQFETTGNDASTIRYLNTGDQIWLSCVSFSSGFFGDGGRADCGFRAYFMRS